MKANVDAKIETLVNVPSDFSDRIIPRGTQGVIVEQYNNPEGYAVDLAIPDKSLVGGFTFENVILHPDQFKVVKGSKSS